jgi:predicted  nucleic acid-binding Zn-ribbon protein
MEQKLDIEHRLTAVEDRSKSNTKRLEDVEKRQDNLDELVSTVKVLAVREENVESDVKEIKSDVKSLKDLPGKRWNAMVEKVLLVAIGMIVTFLLTKLGL